MNCRRGCLLICNTSNFTLSAQSSTTRFARPNTLHSCFATRQIYYNPRTTAHFHQNVQRFCLSKMASFPCCAVALGTYSLTFSLLCLCSAVVGQGELLLFASVSWHREESIYLTKRYPWKATGCLVDMNSDLAQVMLSKALVSCLQRPFGQTVWNGSRKVVGRGY